MQKRVEIFHSLEDENKAEDKRRAKMTPEERLAEFSVLQERRWGIGWYKKPIKKVATWEKVDW